MQFVRFKWCGLMQNPVTQRERDLACVTNEPSLTPKDGFENIRFGFDLSTSRMPRLRTRCVFAFPLSGANWLRVSPLGAKMEVSVCRVADD